jgi:hypothetical protein
MYRIFGSEGGFQDKELRTMQSTSKRGAHDEEASLPEPRETSTQSSPSADTSREKAA